jgi:hypothetical protein
VRFGQRSERRDRGGTLGILGTDVKEPELGRLRRIGLPPQAPCTRIDLFRMDT